jgi:hypothetical protein
MATYSTAAPSAIGAERSAAVPWYVWCSALAVTSAMAGVHWDISWHRSIGRDTFWTPAHIAIYLCGVLAGVSCGYLILATTFGRAGTLRDASVRVWGFRGPLGAFIAAWGGIAMLTSAPFDDWWHGAYGLDVKILSPPHSVLAAGILMVGVGSLLLALGAMNRARGDQRRALYRIYVYLAAMIVVNAAVVILEYASRVIMHSSMFYRVHMIAIPLILIGVARGGSGRWAATHVAAIYMLFWAAINWILPLFPAEPKLGPVYTQVTHFVPSYFPLLLVVPALALDWLWSRTPGWGALKTGLASGVLFFAVFVAVQWPFANFLMSPWSRNWFFYTDARDYGDRPTSYESRNVFYDWDGSAGEFWSGMAMAFGIALTAGGLGVLWGGWLRRVRR